jgi:hypothetical protein
MARKLVRQYYDFGFGAFDSPRGGFRKQPAGTLAEIQNSMENPDGYLGPRYGSKATNAAELNGGTAVGLTGKECWGMTSFFTAAGAEVFVTIMGRTAYKSTDYGVTYEAIAGANTLTEFPWSFATMTIAGVTLLLGCNGSEFIRYDGTTWTPITAPINPHFVAVHQSRVWIGRGDSEVIWASKVADPDTWTVPDALSLPINTNDGNPLSGMIGAGSVLLVFKAYSGSWIAGSGASDVVVGAGAAGLSGSSGCVAHRTIVRAGDSIMWLSARGVEQWTEGGGVKLVSTPIFFTVDESTFLMRARPLYGMIPWACYDDRLQSYRLFTSSMTSGTAIANAGSMDNAYRLLPLHGGWSTDKYAAPTGLTSKGWMAGMIAGTATGQFALYGAVKGLGFTFKEGENEPGDYILSNGATTYKGTILQRVKTPVFDMGIASRRKRLRQIRLVGGRGGATPTTFDMVVEGDPRRGVAAGDSVSHSLSWAGVSSTALQPKEVLTSCRGESFQITLSKTITGAPGTAGAGFYLRSIEAEGHLIERA